MIRSYPLLLTSWHSLLLRALLGLRLTPVSLFQSRHATLTHLSIAREESFYAVCIDDCGELGLGVVLVLLGAALFGCVHEQRKWAERCSVWERDGFGSWWQDILWRIVRDCIYCYYTV